MVNTYQGKLDGQERTFAIIVSRFNELITGKLLGGAIDVLTRHSVADESIDVIWVPGAFEIPLIAGRVAAMRRHDGIVCIGALIRGATSHFDYISAQTSRGIAKVAEDSGIPTTFGVLTCDTQEQALERAGSKAGNKGAEAALACLEAANLIMALDAGFGAPTP